LICVLIIGGGGDNQTERTEKGELKEDLEFVFCSALLKYYEKNYCNHIIVKFSKFYENESATFQKIIQSYF